MKMLPISADKIIPFIATAIQRALRYPPVSTSLFGKETAGGAGQGVCWNGRSPRSIRAPVRVEEAHTILLWNKEEMILFVTCRDMAFNAELDAS